MRGAQAGGVPETAAAPEGDTPRARHLGQPAGLDRAGVRAGRPGDGVHRAHHDRRGLGAAAVGDPAGALPAHLRAGVPRPAADLARGPAVPAPGGPGGRADRPVAVHQQLVHRQLTGVVVFFTTAMLAHRTLYEARPAARYLTEFYLWMSFGGALGGMFTALVAPQALHRDLRVSAAARPLDGVPARRAEAPRTRKVQDEAAGPGLIAAAGSWPSVLPDLVAARTCAARCAQSAPRRSSSSFWPPSCWQACSIRRGSWWPRR